MNLHLKRLHYGEDGVYGNLTGDGVNLYTIEKSYNENGAWTPKIPQGVYDCKRGMHQLQDPKTGSLKAPFETFEVMNVPNHTGCLFHRGNWSSDSHGCILLGLEIDLSKHMLLESAVAFYKFMNAQYDEPGFMLAVES